MTLRAKSPTQLRSGAISSRNADMTLGYNPRNQDGDDFPDGLRGIPLPERLKKSNNANMISHPLLIVGNKVEAKITMTSVIRRSLLKNHRQYRRHCHDSYSEQVSGTSGADLVGYSRSDTEAHVVRDGQSADECWVKDITTPQGSVYPVISTRHLSSALTCPVRTQLLSAA